MQAQLHIFGVTEDFKLWHSLRGADGRWEELGDAAEQTPGPAPADAKDAACALDTAGNLHVLVVANDGRLLHAMRRADPDRLWTTFADVLNALHQDQDGKFKSVAAATEGTTLHVVAAKDDNQLYYTRRVVTGANPVDNATWDLQVQKIRPAPGHTPSPAKPFVVLDGAFFTTQHPDPR